VPPDSTLELDIEAQCLRCGRARELDGSLLVEGERTMVVEAEKPCEACGERRVKVAWDIGETPAKIQA
jgi:hypothetical protein